MANRPKMSASIRTVSEYCGTMKGSSAQRPAVTAKLTFQFTLERDDFSSNRHPALLLCLSMVFSENRYPLFGIMLSHGQLRRAGLSGLCGCSGWLGDSDGDSLSTAACAPAREDACSAAAVSLR